MRTENIYCDFCKKMTTKEGIKKESLNGFCAEVGYSGGGWGSRKDFFPKLSVEICDSCFEQVEAKSKELGLLIKTLTARN